MTAQTDRPDSASPWLFLFGLVVFLGSGVLFVVDLVRGGGIFRSVLGNATGAVILIAWAALDTVRDPDSEVATVGGATGTALLLYGLYLLGAGLLITATGLFLHDRLTLGLLYVGLALSAVVLGYLVFPTGSVVEDSEPTDETDRSATGRAEE